MTKPRFATRKEAAGFAASLAAVVVILVVHYTAPLHHLGLHDVLRRLFYIPVVTAAIATGAWGGLLTSLVAAVAYLPHLRGLDSAGANVLDHSLELVLLLAIGGIVGAFADAAKRARAAASDQAKLAALGEIGLALMAQAEGPLDAIDGQAESIRFLAGRRDDKAVSFAAGVVRDEAARLKRLLVDITSLGRASAGTAAREDLSAVLAGTVGEIRMEHLSGARIEMEPISCLLPVRADRRALRYAFHSLLTGLLECSPLPRRLRLVMRKEGESAVVEIVAVFAEGEPADLERSLHRVFGAGARDYRIARALCVGLLVAQGATVEFRRRPPSEASVQVWFKLQPMLPIGAAGRVMAGALTPGSTGSFAK